MALLGSLAFAEQGGAMELLAAREGHAKRQPRFDRGRSSRGARRARCGHNVNRNMNVNRNRECQSERQRQPQAQRNVNRNVGYHGGVYRGAWVGRPYRWAPGGAIAAGAAIGVIAAGTAVAWAPPPPRSGLCWYYTDQTQRNGFWDTCP